MEERRARLLTDLLHALRGGAVLHAAQHAAIVVAPAPPPEPSPGAPTAAEFRVESLVMVMPINNRTDGILNVRF
ncbi:hypothetical protein C2845_PM16G03010 [Panicum miliaceum]|uniref:Uncharacterized protein n=1 Tax=Panicum miliaceum TaxID=4540 RepID=A0A3L6PVH3_PANMI|nr:hypothetical protein C2845_PM16G03010 [Panicum miliaceum]